MWRAVVSTSRCPADARLLTRAGRSRRKPPQSPARGWRDNLELNHSWKPKGIQDKNCDSHTQGICPKVIRKHYRKSRS